MGLSVVTARVWGEASFASFAGTSDAGSASEGVPFEEKLLNIFGVGIGLG